MNLSLRWKKLKACFDLLHPNFPCFLSPFYMFVDTMIVNFNSSFQYYYWVIDNVVVLNFCNCNLQLQKFAHENNVKLFFFY